MLSKETTIYKEYFLNDDHTIDILPSCPSSMKNPANKTSIYSYRALVVERNNAVHQNDTLETLATLRERYWIVKGHIVVKKVIQRSSVCR